MTVTQAAGLGRREPASTESDVATALAAPVTMAALQTLRRPTEAVISPTGTEIACSVLAAACTDPPDGQRADLWLVRPGEEPRQITHGPWLDSLPRWSPDGQQLAFASDRDHAGLMSVYLLAAEVSEAQPVGDIAGSCEEICWSADGRRLLVLAADPGSDRAGALTATRIEGRSDSPSDPEVTKPRQAWRRLFLVDLADGSTTEVGPPGLNIWEFDWDGAASAVAVISADPSESSWYDASLAWIDLGERVVRARYQPRLQLSGPRLSSDGRRVAFVEGVASDRATWAGGTPQCAELATGSLEPSPISGDLQVSWMCWTDEKTLVYHAWAGLRSSCGRLMLDGTSETLCSDRETVGGRGTAPFSADGAGTLLAAVRESANEPPEVALFDLSEPDRGWQPQTAFNAALRELDLPQWQERRWTSPDGIAVEGLIALPPGAQATGLPLVVIVHGGPVSAWTYQWTNFGHPLLWTAAGYAVLLPNPRGSRGWGPQFAEAILGDMGGGELTDILAGVDALVAEGLADTHRVGIFGASHGGFMSAWAITQTDRFAAGLPMACVSDWLSFHHTTNIGRFDELFVGADPYDAAGAYFDRSPVMHVRNVRTPTLIVHGEVDLCTPIGQARELYRGIADTGQAEVELVVYPREGHGMQERAHQLDFWERARAFFDRHVRG
jgi:dipeptidyl aminopeptidase/acylaminoacyl peptidase